MSRSWEWIVEALASRHGDDAFREAYREVGPPKVPNAGLEAFIAKSADPQTRLAPDQDWRDQKRTMEDPE